MRSIVEISALLLLLAAAGLAFLYLCTTMPGERAANEAAVVVVPAPLVERLTAHVRFLTEVVGTRHRDHVGSMPASADYIVGQFRDAGYKPRIGRFSAGGTDYSNIEAELAGPSNSNIVVVGAHYDSVGFSVGANDNASGVAVLLELARALRSQDLPVTFRFVAFANEEWPFFGTDQMGSRVYARRAKERDEPITAMVALEMLGYFDDARNSQRYPRPLAWFYPDRANFVAVVGNFRSRRLVRDAVELLRQETALAAEGLAAPALLVPDIGRSDHASFWLQGYPAIMITDTGGFRSPHYHRVSDTSALLDYVAMGRVVLALQKALPLLFNHPVDL